jgi:hypothetical protein
MSWLSEANKVIDGIAKEFSTAEGRKAFRKGDGEKRVQGMIAELDALKARLFKYQ